MESSTGLEKAFPFAFLRLPGNIKGTRDDPNSLFYKKVPSPKASAPQVHQPVHYRVHGPVFSFAPTPLPKYDPAGPNFCRPISPPSSFKSPPLDLGQRIFYDIKAPVTAYRGTESVHNDTMASRTSTHVDNDPDLAYDKLRAIKARRSAVVDKLFGGKDTPWGTIDEFPVALSQQLKAEWVRMDAGIERIEALIARLEETQKHNALNCAVCAAFSGAVKEPSPPRADQEHQPETSRPED